MIAATAAISSPLLETSISGATGVLVSITAAPDIGLDEVDIASSMIAKEAHPDANIIWGAAFDPLLEDEMRVTIIATGFEKSESKPTSAPVRTGTEAQAHAAPSVDSESPAPSVDFPESQTVQTAQAQPAPATTEQFSGSDEELMDILAILGKRR